MRKHNTKKFIPGLKYFYIVIVFALVTLAPESLAANGVAPPICDVEIRELVSRDYRDISNDLTKSAVLNQHQGDLESASKCSQKLFEVSTTSTATSWKDKLSATLLFVDILKKQNRLESISRYLVFASEQFPGNTGGDSVELIMFSSSLADYLYIIESQNAYFAYAGLLELGKCNPVAKTAYATYENRRERALDWVPSGSSSWPRMDECPSVEFFVGLLER